MEITVDELLEFNPPSIYTDEEARKIASQSLQIALGLVESYCRGCPYQHGRKLPSWGA